MNFDANQKKAAVFGHAFDFRIRPVEAIDVIQRIQTRDEVEITIWKRDALSPARDIPHRVSSGAERHIIFCERIQADAFSRHSSPFQATAWTASDIQYPFAAEVARIEIVDGRKERFEVSIPHTAVLYDEKLPPNFNSALCFRASRKAA